MNEREIQPLDAVDSLDGQEQPIVDQVWVEVLVDCPGAQGLYTYVSPMALNLQVGDILSVPFATQWVGAIALRVRTHSPDDLDLGKIRAVDAVLSRGFFPLYYWQLLDQVATYYQTSLMQVVKVALPPGLLTRSQRRLRLVGEALEGVLPEEMSLSAAALNLLEQLMQSRSQDYAWKFLQQKVKGLNRASQELMALGWVESYLQPPDPLRPKLQKVVTFIQEGEDLSDRQQVILDCLKKLGGEVWLTDLLQYAKASTATVQKLEEKGCVTLQMREILRQEVHAVPPDQPKPLTADQQQVLQKIQTIQGAQQILLHGVTGSGKTEVYLQAIAPLLANGQSALVLVPEIGLTPQLTDRFRARFGDRVCVYHSALSEGERYDTWRQLLRGQPQVVIGTRSAIFAPLTRLGMIVLDEEHDTSFKQDQPAPCYHARTVAQMRAQLENCPLILGSATPSFESWFTVQQGQAIYLQLPRRVLDRPMPPIQVVDMRQELVAGNRSIFSRSLQKALGQLKAKGQQGLLFIHRRGHSTHVSCRSCGYVMECPHCDVALAYHQIHADAAEILRCHYCGYTQRQPQQCPVCDSPYFKHFGSGTQRVTQELAVQFPELKVLRFDSDTTRNKGAHRTLLQQFARGEADLLVGTQMLTKGMDLPQVTLVGIVAADGLLHLQDFRASERAFQTLLQVSGRAGRGEQPGQVLLQTYHPDHPVIHAVVVQDYAAFAEAELLSRAVLHYPPLGRLLLFRLSSPDAIAVQKAAERVAQALRRHRETLHADPSSALQTSYEVVGPAPAAILRVAQRYRWQIILRSFMPSSKGVELDAAIESTSPDLLIPALQDLRSLCGNTVSLTLDVDPMNLM
ncbi:MAG: primosomal protein N' [Synechococcales bacterium]|nr:primosomal protein N' [Synechococcales bacterium]